MEWKWSHTVEAYAAAQRNVEKQSREWLEVVYAEWQAHTSHEDDAGAFDHERYEAALREAKDLPENVLTDFVWYRMSEQAICDNGGHEAWCCPFGCGCHTVPFHDDVKFGGEVCFT